MFKIIKKYFIEDYHRPTAKIIHFYVLFKKLFYNNKSDIFSEKSLLLKNPPESTIFYNLLGRFFFIFFNFFSILIFNRYIDSNTNLDKSPALNIVKGTDNEPWPQQSIHSFEKNNENLDNEYFNQIEKNYFDSLTLISQDKRFKDNDWWLTFREEFINNFFNDKKINLTSLENFRSKNNFQVEILNDQNYLSVKKSTKINKIKSLFIINLYHKLSSHIDLTILRMTSDSYCGNNLCVNYRGQRLTSRILRYAYYSSQIKTYTNLDTDKTNLILDIGGGYGGLIRVLKNIYYKSTFVLIELPELCLLSSFFLKKCFPDKKIGLLNDFINKKEIKLEDLNKFDLVVLPQSFMDLFSDNIFDLVINTTSLGEMTEKNQNFYINNIERICSSFFYSMNRSSTRIEKYNAKGFYDFNFKKRWLSLIYKYSHTYHIEFLGKIFRDR